MNLRSAFVPLVLFAVAVGCGGPPTISGSVTYDGKPVEKGSVSFVPQGGQGTPFGGAIVNGAYKVEKAVAGKRTVIVSGYEMPPIPPGSTEPVYAKKTVPADAVGNNQEVEIKPGAQTLDFQLMPPK